MANLLDYLYFRKDIRFQEKAFNKIDALILSELAYVDWDSIVGEKEVSLKKACRLFLKVNSEDTLKERYAYAAKIPNMIKAVQKMDRYQDIKIRDYITVLDEEKVVQFAACTFVLPFDALMIAYRGTDSTILGWQEDMHMTYQDEVESQKLAAQYLDNVMKQLPVESSFFGLRKQVHYPQIYLGGHSKGGNLAMYALLKTQWEEHITKVYNFDGPGFRDSFLAQNALHQGWDKIESYLPKCSIIGRLLSQHEKVRQWIVDGDMSGLSQHDPFHWHVDVNDFVYVEKLEKESDEIHDYIRTMLLDKEDQKKQEYIALIFSILGKLEITQISDLSELTLKKAMSGIVEFTNMNGEERKFMIEVIHFLFSQTKSILFKRH